MSGHRARYRLHNPELHVETLLDRVESIAA
jgi:hypothetical protein